MDSVTYPRTYQGSGESKVFQVTIVGSRFIGIESSQLLNYNEFTLKPDPKNVHDPGAVAVLVRDKRVGWVAKTSQKDLPELRLEGSECEVISSYMDTPNAIFVTMRNLN